MDVSPRLPALMPNIRLGVRGLPTLTNSLLPGGLYVLVAETASARFPLLASSLNGALKDGRRCTVVVPGNPESFVQRLETQGELQLQRPLASGQCQIFETQDEFPKKMFRFGTERFLRELEHFDVSEHGYLVFDQADDLISLHDISLALEQVETLTRWLAEKQVTALLVFLRLTDAHAANLNALMDNLAGIARLDSDEEGLRLAFDYWQSPEGTIVARYHPLVKLDSGLYEAIQRSVPAYEASGAGASSSQVMQAPPPAVDEPLSYFYMDPDLGSLSTLMPGQWQLVDSLVGVMHATRQHRAPVVIFCYRSDTRLRLLAEAVHTLRVNLGPYAQLIVQEKDASLRYQNEALLLRLGLNLVIHRDVPPARMPLLLSSLTGQLFNRDVDIDFEAALSSVAPARLRGYQPPATFVREVRGLLERSATLNIPFVLLVGLPVPAVSMLDVLTLVKLSRAGDLVTADTRHCYIFLNACQQPVALSALERILGTSVDEVFETLRFQVQREDVELELEALLHNASTGMALDYSAQLPQVQPPSQQAQPSGQAVGVFEPSPSPAVPDKQYPSAGPVPARTSTSELRDPRLGAVPLAPTPYRQGLTPSSVYGREAAPRAQRKTPSSSSGH